MKRKYLSVLVPALYPMIMAAMVLLVRYDNRKQTAIISAAEVKAITVSHAADFAQRDEKPVVLKATKED
jgi:hypothetical protein